MGLSAGSALQDHLGQHALRGGGTLNVRVRVRGFDALCRMVERGVGLGIVPETAARRCHLTLCVRRFDALPAHAQRLVEHLRTN